MSILETVSNHQTVANDASTYIGKHIDGMTPPEFTEFEIIYIATQILQGGPLLIISGVVTPKSIGL